MMMVLNHVYIGDRIMNDFGEDGCVALNAVLDAADD